jgi:acyl-CoA hydrolase
MIKTKRISESCSIMTEMIMPNDTNPLGWMDIAAAICANRHAEAYCVTVSVDNIAFYKPIKLGQVITLEAKVTRAFNTSMEVYVKVFGSDSRKTEKILANHAFFSFVALDEHSLKPMEVVQVEPETEEEKRLFESALARREMRLLLSGRLEGKNAVLLREVLDGTRLFH